MTGLTDVVRALRDKGVEASLLTRGVLRFVSSFLRPYPTIHLRFKIYQSFARLVLILSLVLTMTL